MISSISFKNYKAFEKGELELRPITILLGANSVGKTSILQLFLMLQQTALTEKSYQSALRLNGGFVSLGEGDNLFRRRITSQPLSISLKFMDADLTEVAKSQFSEFCLEMLSIAGVIRRLAIEKEMRINAENPESKEIKEQVKIARQLRKLFPKNFSDEEIDLFMPSFEPADLETVFTKKVFVDLVNVAQGQIRYLGSDFKGTDHYQKAFWFRRFRVRRPSDSGNPIAEFRANPDEYVATFDLLNGFRQGMENPFVKVNYEIDWVDKHMMLSRFSVSNDSDEVISLSFDTSKGDDGTPLLSVSSDYIPETQFSSKIRDLVKSLFVTPRSIFSFVDDRDSVFFHKPQLTILAKNLSSLLVAVNKAAEAFFVGDKVNYVNPLRAHPKRYYLLDRAKVNSYVDALDGDAIAETLKENPELTLQVNKWMERFGLKVEIKPLQDVIHRMTVRQDALGLELDIPDVGFGISQVLPVIIQSFLAKNQSLTIIEQPEIHLHPTMQADLGDLFIDVVRPENPNGRRSGSPTKFLLIETHSEYLLKRLRRRISEGKINADDVALYSVTPQNTKDGACLERLGIDKQGDFSWPKDFYGEALRDDTVIFIKNQLAAL